jgi:ABC-type glycerol-3-phosphate transport system permease component
MPFAWAFVSSLKPLEEVYAFPPSFDLGDPQWSNYAEAFTRLPVARFLANSMLIAGLSVMGAVLTSSMAGFILARGRFRGRTICFMVVIASMLVPGAVLLVPRFMLFDLLGWIDTYKPLIVPAWLGGGAFNIFLFRQFFRAIPREFDDAASLDGATMWQTYWHVLLPMAKPAVVTVALLSFVYHWQEFLDPLIYLSDFNTFPISLGLRMYQSMAGTWANLLMATSLIALVPVVIVFCLCERHIMRGLGVIGRESA